MSTACMLCSTKLLSGQLGRMVGLDNYSRELWPPENWDSHPAPEVSQPHLRPFSYVNILKLSLWIKRCPTAALRFEKRNK